LSACAELTRPPWWWLGWSSPVGHRGDSSGARQPAMEEVRTDLVCHRSHLLRPPPLVSSSPRPLRLHPRAPLRSRRQPPLATAPDHLAYASCPDGPHGGQCWQHAQRATKRGKLGSASSLRNCSRESNLRWLRCRSCFVSPFSTASWKTAAEAAHEAVLNGP
jgi:hypothetical protein